ncbi:sensor histidine kinase [Desulfosporosinus lacus]|uniref:histidine kinase n=1 Tax=Desulfosporosinus lacus DSM 15449 TaxID=1121420 RepID=A0A1M5ZTV6_9FIRM|nr:ATP-binding protein [Desulfosporosinus lacus]SHI27735.1 His Kinase A (phospho-acceptor) domain-containing protein [Desulfosporosinus lacus DSM 15449]
MSEKLNKSAWKTIPKIIQVLRVAEDTEVIRKYENIIICMYASSLLYLASAASFIARFFFERQNWENYLPDSLVLLLAGIVYSVLARLEPDRKLLILSPVLTAVIFIFVTVRFYYLIGPAVWTLAFIQLILAMFWVSRSKLYALGLAVVIASFYIVSRHFFAESYQIGIVYYITQGVFIVFLAFIAAAFHKICIDRYCRIEHELQKTVKQKEEISVLYEEKMASEEELREALERLQKNQEQMIQQEKLAGIGQLAAGVAHEINNPLGYIASNYETSRDYYHQLKEANREFAAYMHQMSADKLEKNAEILSKLKEINDKKNILPLCADLEEIHHDIEEGLARIREIVQGMTTYVRVEPNNDFADFDLNKNIQSTLFMVKNEIKHSARVVELLGDIPTIQAKGSHISQVLVNIILNAVQAIKAKESDTFGTIIISTELSKDVVICQIEDNGIGISEENLHQVFNPFFSTKPIGQGTGLGLSIAYDIIVNEHGGQLLVQSTEHVGSKFIIKLPVSKLE